MPEDVHTGLADGDRHTIELALRAGRKIEAIKLYREATGADLLEAKQAIESMEEAERPVAEADARPIKPSGCIVVLATLALAVTTFVAALT